MLLRSHPRYFGLVMADGIWTDDLNFWTTSNGSPNYGSTTNIPFTGTFTVGSTGATVYLEKQFTTNYVEAIFGVRMFLNTTGATFFNGGTTNNCILIHLLDSGTSQLSLRIRGDKTLGIYRGSTLVQAGTYVYPNATFVHMEWRVQIDNSTGASKNVLKIYDAAGTVTDIDIAAASDTQATTNAYFNQVRVGPAASTSAVPCAWCDWYMVDTTDAVDPVDFLGNTRILFCNPNGTGNYSQWVNSSGNSTNNYQRVDENSPNSDTDYVESDTATEKDSYTFEDIATTYTIRAVGVHCRARKTDVGSRELKAFTRISGTDYEGVSHVLQTTYVTGDCTSDFWANSPATSTPWTPAELNGAEFGIKVEV